MAVEIVETSNFELDKPILIEGFPGVGLVGTISTSFLVDKLKMAQLGYVSSDRFPPIAAIHNRMPLHPARLYQSKKHNIAVLFSEFIIPLNTIYELSKEILAWSRKRGVREIVSLGGIVVSGEQDEVYGIASTKKLSDALEAKGIKSIKEGAITGVSGVLLAKCAATGFPAVSLLAEAQPSYLDPKAAALVLKKLGLLTGVEVETKELIEEAKGIEAKMKEILERARNAHQHYKQVEEMGTMYR